MSSINTTLVGWQPESGGRGTWSIIWLCLSTASIALWVVYHGSAPWEDVGFSSLRWPLSQISDDGIFHIIWTVCAILVPELYIFMAAWQLIEAKNFRDEVRNSHPPFTLSEAFFVSMGGYRISIPQKYKDPKEPWRKTGALTGGQILWLIGEDVLGWSQQATSEGKNRPSSGSEKQAFLFDRETIKQRSRSNGFAKFVVIFQAFWFIVNCSVRGAHKLPLSLPEVLTLSYIMCTFIAYAFWWHKPQGIGECAIFKLQLTDAEWEELMKRGGEAPLENGMVGFEYMEQNFKYSASTRPIYWLIFLSSWLSGGMHFIAWNDEFPSTAEQILWRTCTIMLMCLAPLIVCDSRVFTFRKDHFTPDWWQTQVGLIGLFVAAITKFSILILAALSLRSAPEAIYDTYEITNYLLLSL